METHRCGPVCNKQQIVKEPGALRIPRISLRSEICLTIEVARKRCKRTTPETSRLVCLSRFLPRVAVRNHLLSAASPDELHVSQVPRPPNCQDQRPCKRC